MTETLLLLSATVSAAATLLPVSGGKKTRSASIVPACRADQNQGQSAYSLHRYLRTPAVPLVWTAFLKVPLYRDLRR